MRFLSPLKNAVKAIPFPAGHQWSPWGWQWDNRSSDLYRRSNINYVTEVGELTDSSAVMTCLQWILRVWPESPLAVFQDNEEGKPSVLPRHPLSELVANPSPDYSSGVLWMGTLLSWFLDGNAYWYLVRNSFREPVQIRYLPHTTMRPKWPDDGSEFISHYEYNIEGRIYRIPKEDVIHFRYGFDPRDQRLGLSPLRAVLREVFTDNEAALYSAVILKNMGAVPALISPDPTVFKESSAVISRERAEEMKDQWQRRSTGDERGKPMVHSVPVKVQGGQDFAFSPEQLAIREVRKIPEERVSAAFGIPAVVVGLGAGLDRSTYNNVKEAREQAYESCIIPTQTLFAQELDRRLLPEWSTDNRVSTGFDRSRVTVLAEDHDQKAKRAVMVYEKGLATRGEARTMADLKDRGAEDDVYFPGTDPEEVAAEKEEQAAAAAERLETMRENGGGAEQNGRNGSEPAAVRSLPFRDERELFIPASGKVYLGARERRRLLQEFLAAAGAASRESDGEGAHGCREADPQANGGPPAAHGGNGARGTGTNGT